jgi:hypothetical protein
MHCMQHGVEGAGASHGEMWHVGLQHAGLGVQGLYRACGACVGHGRDILLVMGLARWHLWGVMVSHGLVTWWLSPWR